MKRYASESSERIKKMLLQDRMNTSEDFIEVLNSDLWGLLSEYMEIIPDTLGTKITTVGDLFYDINITLKASRIKSISIVK